MGENADMEIRFAKLKHDDYIKLVEYVRKNSYTDNLENNFFEITSGAIKGKSFEPYYTDVSVKLNFPQTKKNTEKWATKLVGLAKLVSSFC